jgi:hypothetical protein
LDPDVNKCVCKQQPSCCTTAWDDSCVKLAETQCGTKCDCHLFPFQQLTCSSDSDCDWCEPFDTEGAPWVCCLEHCFPAPDAPCTGIP